MVIVPRRHAVFGGIWLDASLEELHIHDAEVTDHPVEDGSDISDHVRARPVVVRITGQISNEPIELPQSHAEGVSLAKKTATFDKGPPSGLVGVTGGGVLGGALATGIGSLLGLNEGAISADGFSEQFDRAADVYAELIAIKEEARIFDIETTLATYESMVLQSFEVPRSVETGQGLRFTAIARQLFVVTAETVEVPEPKVTRGIPKQNAGKKPTKAAGIAGALGDSVLAQTVGL